MGASFEQAIRYYATHPVEWVQDVITAEPDENQVTILNSVAHNQMTAVRSGHGIGKTTAEAWAVLWYLCTHPFARVPCTAPTEHQLNDLLWPEIAKWMRRSPVLSRDLRWTKERVAMRGYEEVWFAVPRTASNPENLQGFHAENLLYVIDEASGVSDDIFAPILGALSTEGAHLLISGNPTKLTGFFYEAFHKNRASYSTIHVDARNSRRVSKEYVDTAARQYGEDSNFFRVRVMGEFPRAEDDVFIPLYLLEEAARKSHRSADRPATIDIAVDVARFGSDKTVIGYKVDRQVTFHKKISGQDTMRTIGDTLSIAEELVDRYGFRDEIIPVKVDAGGMGGPVIDRLLEIQRGDPERYGWMSVQPVHFGSHIKNRQYDDTTSFMLGTVRNLLQMEDEDGHPMEPELILPEDDALIAQLSARKYKITSTGRIKVESKEDMKKRGLSSPDEADCLCMLCLPFDRERAKRQRRRRRQ